MTEVRTRILVVEDNKFDQLIFEHFVQDECLPYDYTLANSILAAKNILAATKFDIVITDYALGDGTAFDILNSITNTPIVIVTGAGDQEIAITAMKNGAYDYLIKDHNHQYLKLLPSTVKNVLKHHQEKKRNLMLSHAMMNIDESVCITDKDDKIIFVNKAFSQLYGYQPAEILGSYYYILMSEKSSHETGGRREIYHKHQNGQEIFVSVSRSVLQTTNDDDMVIVEVARDATQLEQAVQSQAQIVEELKQANQELEDFALNVSHHLKDPLRAIGSLADWISTDYAQQFDEQGQEQIRLLVDRVHRMHQLVDGIFQYSRVSRVKEKKVAVDLNELVAEVIDFCAPPKQIKITFENLPVITAAKTQLQTIFQNLLDNAIKYGCDFVRDGEQTQAEVTISCYEKADVWQFGVSDNGSGIEAKHFDKVFQMFQMLSPSDQTESTGIGLAMIKKIVENEGGQVWVEAGPEKGSIFYFTLPK